MHSFDAQRLKLGPKAQYPNVLFTRNHWFMAFPALTTPVLQQKYLPKVRLDLSFFLLLIQCSQ